MRKKFFIGIVSVLAVAASAALLAGGCSKSVNSESYTDSSKNDVSNSETVVSKDTEKTDNTVSYAEKESSQTEDESSAEESIVSEQESEAESVIITESSAESVEESNDDSSQQVSEKSEMSYEGYQFDDENIVTDYHTATEFTSDEEFNHIFDKNTLDKEYNSLLMDASSGAEMRKITSDYSEKWKTLADKVYLSLSEKLSNNESEKAKLEESQEKWKESLEVVENSFYEEAKEGGTDGLLAAEGAILNYYKGRTAVLLEQIFVLQGSSIVLSDFGI